jgi:hypothetical protein
MLSRDHIFRSARSTVLSCAALTLALTATATATPAPPPNDNRADATVLAQLPQTVRGTTVGATIQANEPGSGCADTAGSVWYAISTGGSPPARVGLRLSANGDLDAAIDVYIRQRSQLGQIDCRRTDDSGRAALAFVTSPGTTYLIRIATRDNSDAGTFTLRAFGLPAPPSPPGRLLTLRGADGVLDGTFVTTTAYSMRLTAGTTYKINLVKRSSGCMSLGIFPPGTTSFRQNPVAELSCAGYRLFTPRVSGRWSFEIVASADNEGTQPYGLHVRTATAKEMVPGIWLGNFAPYTGFLRGNVIDDVRLFRFDVMSRSDLTLFLMAGSDAPFDLKLLNDRGRYLQCNCGSSGQETIRRQIDPGRYYVVVQAHDFGWGQFTLTRELRLITHVTIAFNGVSNAEVAPGALTHLVAHITPAVSGPVTIEVQFFDPVERWQYHRTFRVQAVNGVAQMALMPSHIGRWRATVSYDGTKTASPATGGPANLLVAGPLRP